MTQLLFRHTPIKGNGFVGFISWIIRMIEGVGYDHVALLYKGNVYEASLKGTRCIKLKEWEKLYKNQRHELREIQGCLVLSEYYLAQHLRYNYDFISIPFQLIYRITNKWFWRTWSSKKSFYCSEYVAYLLRLPYWWKTGVREVYEQLKKAA